MQVSFAIFDVKVHRQPERDWIDLCYTGEVPGKSYCCPKKNFLVKVYFYSKGQHFSQDSQMKDRQKQ